ncbi:TPA: hypothetical protein O6S24_002001 [Staphylococcus aureus]|uniref:hypothetical protein n=1 Tax=Staphylococcus TaxID=1279 RepID=UPI0007CA4EAC|nr:MULTISPECIES: hypothetical protein [Staphylococcus]EGQ3259970.1 hypothetical protein [Staphylococcus pseudintermedius]EGQ3289231.1 hypothetical protein [Staphylococcus pseudintermedius]EJD5651491.1 hypothetical protein [Staphylococcus pseudintermedius]EJG0093085.1 hypothetical protein [Staphylococcus pseudintermedius]EKO1102703.1 hypothetical protein [Staphylococcus pseudintermedius]
MKIALNISSEAKNELNKRSKLLGITNSATIHLLWYINVREELSFDDLTKSYVVKETQMQMQVKDYLIDLFEENQPTLKKINNKYSLYIEHLLSKDQWSTNENWLTNKKQMVVNISNDTYRKIQFIKEKTNVSIKSMLNYSLLNLELDLENSVKMYDDKDTVKINVSVPKYLKDVMTDIQKRYEVNNNILVDGYIRKFLENFNGYLEKYLK